jgi:hypothetical protein
VRPENLERVDSAGPRGDRAQGRVGWQPCERPREHVEPPVARRAEARPVCQPRRHLAVERQPSQALGVVDDGPVVG